MDGLCVTSPIPAQSSGNRWHMGVNPLRLLLALPLSHLLLDHRLRLLHLVGQVGAVL